jgi:hypothetical protein
MESTPGRHQRVEPPAASAASATASNSGLSAAAPAPAPAACPASPGGPVDAVAADERGAGRPRLSVRARLRQLPGKAFVSVGTN